MNTLFLFLIIIIFFSACCAIDHKTDIESTKVYYKMEQRKNRKK